MNALTTKATTLECKGQSARAAEIYAAVIAAALALGQRDCLVVAMLQVMHANALLNAKPALGTDMASLMDLSMRRIFVCLLPAPLAALQRRKAAGTLHSGACLPHEVSWFAVKIVSDMNANGIQARTRNFAQEQAVHIGYDNFLMASCLAMQLFLFGADTHFAIPHEALHAAYTFIEDGLMILEQGRPGFGLATESSFISSMQTMADKRFLADNPWHVRIVNAWQRVQRSGVLQQRSWLIPGIELLRTSVARQHARSIEGVAAHGLHGCALPSCRAREAHVFHFQRCAGCKIERYCCKEHQTTDWPRDKVACKAASAAAAREEAAGGGAGLSA